ncbi:MAG TPA: hypothetical protein VGK59_06775 [Ohtaekwangia sp.]
MSSHHFVREGQEPALIIVDATSHELAEPLLEWVPLVVVVDTALEAVKSWGIKIDVVIQTTLEEETIHQLLSDQFPLQVISGKPNDNSIANALDYCLSVKQHSVNLMMDPDSDRFDLLEGYTSFTINVFSHTEKWSLCRGRFEKWMPAKSQLSIRQVSRDQKMVFEGLIFKGSQTESIHDGTIRIQSPALFWVGEPF